MKNEFPLFGMYVAHESFSLKKELYTPADSIDPGQPKRTVQAVLGRNLLLIVNFLYAKGLYHPIIHLVLKLGEELVKRKRKHVIRVVPIT